MVEPIGFLPTEWMPMSMALPGGKLYVATAKGKGTGPNNFPQRQVPGQRGGRQGSSTYIATLLYGSLAVLDVKGMESGAAEVDGRGAGVEPDEGGRGEDSVCRTAARTASSM